MNIDERIEALTHSVELLSQIHQDNEKAYNRRFQQTEERFQQGEARLDKILDAIERLAHIAEIHEHRISGLEGAP